MCRSRALPQNTLRLAKRMSGVTEPRAVASGIKDNQGERR